MKRLSTTWQRVRSVPGLGRDVLAVVLLLIAGVAVGGALLASQQVSWPWQDEFVFTAEFESVPAIAPGQGQEVRIAGVPVGDIREAEVTEDGVALLTLAISSDNRIYDNAQLVLRPKSPLNEMYVTINPGGPPGGLLTEGAVIPREQTEQPVQVDEVLSHLDTRTREALTAMLAEADVALANLPENLPPGLRAAEDTFTALQPVMEALETRSEKIRTLVNALSQIAAAVGDDDVRLASIANSLQTTLGTVASNDDDVEAALAQLPEVSSRLREATTGVERLSTQLDPTLDNLEAAAPELPGALNDLRDTAVQAGQTLDVAGPFVEKAQPVVADLRPFVVDVRAALADLEPTTTNLDPVTETLVPNLVNVKSFFALTASVTSVRDANGGMFRAKAIVAPETIPSLPKSLQREPVEAPPR